MTNILIIACLVVFVFIAIVITAVKLALKRESRIYTEGIETDSIVSKSEHYFDRDHDSRYRCYVTYTGDDGFKHEGLLNLRSDLPVGRKVRIRYTPGKYDYVVFVSQDLNT